MIPGPLALPAFGTSARVAHGPILRRGDWRAGAIDPVQRNRTILPEGFALCIVGSLGLERQIEQRACSGRRKKTGKECSHIKTLLIVHGRSAPHRGATTFIPTVRPVLQPSLLPNDSFLKECPSFRNQLMLAETLAICLVKQVSH